MISQEVRWRLGNFIVCTVQHLHVHQIFSSVFTQQEEKKTTALENKNTNLQTQQFAPSNSRE